MIGFSHRKNGGAKERKAFFLSEKETHHIVPSDELLRVGGQLPYLPRGKHQHLI